MNLITNMALPIAMNNKVKKSLVDTLSIASSKEQSVTILRQGRPVAVVLSNDDYTQFEIDRAERLKNLQTELTGILSLIRSRLNNQGLAALEAQLAAHRKKIEQENK
jgi:PHD/YefM family antitoxin component YafN of YafNO toxin-antitoxin module